MPLKIIKGRNLPIGLDVGSSAIKMAQLRQVDQAYDLLAAGMRAIEPEIRGDFRKRLAFVGESVREMLKSNDFKGRECIISLPADETVVQHVRVPKMGPDETAKAVRQELNGKLPWPLAQAVVRHVVAGELPAEGEVKQEVIAVASSKATVEAYLSMARKAKLDVVGINVESCALVECFGRLFRRNADAARTILYLDIGLHSTQVVLSHGNHIVFARNLGVGGALLDAAVAETLEIPIEQAQAMRRDLVRAEGPTEAGEELYRMLSQPLDQLAEQLMQCLHYYESIFRNQSIERAIFLGGVAYDKRLCQGLAQRLNLPAQIGDPLVRCGRVEGAGLGIGLDRREPQPDWAVAVGLSLGAPRAA
jgi:type IV pilus assembly protein PilM